MDASDRFRILTAVALADGHLDPGEQELLTRCAAWLGIPRPRAGELLREVRANPTQVAAVPLDPAARAHLFVAVVNITLADGRVSEQEAACLRSLALAFGITPEQARRVLAEASERWSRARGTRHGSGRLASEQLAAQPTQTSFGAPRSQAPRPANPVFAAIPAPRPPLEPGTVVGGKFEVVAPLGQGGFGAVFRARHADLDEEVALKVLLPSLVANHPDAEKRFLREVKLAKAFAHRYAVPLREFGRDPRHGLFFTMDLVSGDTLSSLCAVAPPPAARVTALAAQALEALAEAHRIGIVHRDIKPANLMVTVGPTGEEEVRLLDFGVAKAVSAASEDPATPELTRAGALVGTPTYMSPEQAQGRRLDPRSDLYSLAVVVYEAVCGCLPYGIDPDVEDVQRAIHYQIVAEPPRDPLEVAPELPRRLGDALLRALAKDPAERYSDAAAFRAALVEAKPDARASRGFTGWVRERLRREPQG